MSEFKSALRTYDLDKALAADRGDDCLVIDVGHNENGEAVPSLQRIVRQVNHHVHNAPALAFAATKLYIIGKWILTPSQGGFEVEADEGGKKTEASAPHIFCPAQARETRLTHSSSSNLLEQQARADSVAQWREATEKLGELLKQMGNLRKLTWISGLPFTAAVWGSLPSTLAKLVLDLGEPVRLEQDGDVLHKSYIIPDEMRSLQEQVKLKELRLFRVHNSFQLMVWETVFRNTSEGGMRILDVQMAAAPIVRSEQWKKAKDVVGLTVALENSAEKGYKGMDGKGILHYTIGTGEYLDDYCIRKARIASGLDEATPLPLWCLKLDGFVIDHMPFDHELSRIVLLTCGDDCIDSGLRAPKTDQTPHNKWSKVVNNASSHCLIKWPNWMGIFDNHGAQRDKLGLVIPQDLVYSTSLEEFSPTSPTVPLTKNALHMKELNEALGGATELDYRNDSDLLGKPAIAETPMSVVSNKSDRGSDVPTLTAASSTIAHSPRIPTVDGTDLAATTSFGSSDADTVDSLEEALSPVSTMSSFEQVDNPASDIKSNAATAGSDITTEESTTPNKATLAHRVRRSFDWLTGSSLS